MQRRDINCLDPTRTYWVLSVVSPERDWAAAPACRKGARLLVDPATFHAGCDAFETFDSELSCLKWIMRHRSQLNHALPGARVRAVRLDRWLLGME
jgi:hypothetical protein